MRLYSSLSDNELILETRKGNDSAFTALVGKHDRRVLMIIAQYCHCSDDAKDIYQEIFIRAYKGLDKFEFRSEFSTWLYRIATNVCLNHRSNKTKNDHVSLSADDDDGNPMLLLSGGAETEPENKLLNSEVKKKISRALNSLPAKQKNVFILKHINGLKFREIAEIMECGEGTVKKYHFLAVAKLRQTLNDEIIID